LPINPTAGASQYPGGCLQPVLLRGRVDHIDGATGELLHRYTHRPRARRCASGAKHCSIPASVTLRSPRCTRLLKAILNTAVDDGMIRRNPCRIKGAGQEKSPERPVLTIRQVLDLANAIDQRYRLLVLLAVFCSLRWGELAALRLRHIDLTRATVYVEASVVELIDGSRITGPPKSQASKRVVSIPPFLLPQIASHIENFTQGGSDDLLFVGPKNAPLRRPNFTRTWRRATASAGLTGVHFHDLRHAGNHFAAATGASLRELMGRMGHSTTRAALIYQHRTTERDRLIAGRHEQAGRARTEPPHRRIGHTTGTRTEQGFMTMGATLATMLLTSGIQRERVTGIEPALSAWEADVLPLNYTRADRGRQ
jgi:integrase